MHTAALSALGIDGAYLPFAVAPEHLEQAVRGLLALGFTGFNVTLPHKTAIMALLEAVEPDARAIGAVNTVVRVDDTWLGANTDAPGLAEALVSAGVSLPGARVMVLGAGGAARAAVVGLGRAGAAHVTVAARREDAANALAADLGPVVAGCSLEVCALTADSLAPRLVNAGLLVQATSASLGGGPPAEELAALIPLEAMKRGSVVTDLVYTPRITPLLRRADKRGLAVVDGLGMLLHQGALALTRWTGRAAPVAAMRAALRE